MAQEMKDWSVIKLIKEVAQECGWKTAFTERSTKNTAFCSFSIDCPYVGEMAFGVNVRKSDTICDVSLKVDKHLGEFNAEGEAHNLIWIDDKLRLGEAIEAMRWYEGEMEQLAMVLNQAW